MSSRPRDVAQEETVELDPEFRPPRGPPQAEIGARIGRFRVERHLGQGGMGLVVAAHDPDLDRTVAIKLLRGGAFASQPDGSGKSRGRERLVREARAMARLSHPNILAVYEVGLSDDLVYIAMEHAAGGTLTSWLSAARRPWREVVARFLEAGKGLAAAHAAGLVHRDFKPDNTLLMEDGRVCVADFGLVGVGPAPAVADGDAAAAAGAASAVMGTPLYMAPEQVEQKPPDARADQFSFCVALYEALYHELPFSGRTLGERLAAIKAGRVVAAPADARVPSPIRAALLRGLAADPAARFPSMNELLAVLRADPDARRRRVLGAAAAALVAGGLGASAVAGLARDPRRSLCHGGAAEVAEVWNDAVRARVRAAFSATGVGHAADTFARASAAVDGYAGRWAAMRDDACAATQTRGTQSAAVLDLRMRCLDDERAGLRVALSLLATADRATVDRAVTMTSALEPVSDCADARALAAPMAEPGAPAARARLARLRESFAEADTRSRLGRVQEATALAAINVATARALAFPPTLATALFRLGVLLTRSGDARAAEALLREAVQMAGRARDDNLAVVALAELAFALDRQGRPEEALAIRPWAEMELARGGATELARSKLLLSLAAPLRSLGKLDEARSLLEEAVAIRERLLGAGDAEVAAPLSNLGNVLAGQGRLPEARRAFERALEIGERTLGPDHPEVAYALTNLAIVLRLQGDLEGSLALLERARALRERSLGAAHPELARTLDNLGDTLAELGRLDDARRALERALSIKEQRLRPDHPDLAYTLTALGKTLLSLNRPADAVAPLERAVAILAAAPARPERADALFALARALDGAHGDRRRALALATQARALLDPSDTKGAAEVDTWLRPRRADKR